jgi:hypothetical protein
MVGKLNYDVWRHPVGYLVDDLRIKRVFPSQPEKRQTIDKLQTIFNARDKDSLVNKYGHKIYGYLLPKAAGPYQLRAELSQVTAACSVEVWLSSGPSPLSTGLVTSVQAPMLGRSKTAVEKRQDSSIIQLEQGAYYFEFLEKAFDGKCAATILVSVCVSEREEEREKEEQVVHILCSGRCLGLIRLLPYHLTALQWLSSWMIHHLL